MKLTQNLYSLPGKGDLLGQGVSSKALKKGGPKIGLIPALAKKIGERRALVSAMACAILPEIDSMLLKSGVTASVRYEVKSFEGFVNDFMASGRRVAENHDALTVKIFVGSLDDCYRVLEMIRAAPDFLCSNISGGLSQRGKKSHCVFKSIVRWGRGAPFEVQVKAVVPQKKMGPPV